MRDPRLQQRHCRTRVQRLYLVHQLRGSERGQSPSADSGCTLAQLWPDVRKGGQAQRIGRYQLRFDRHDRSADRGGVCGLAAFRRSGRWIPARALHEFLDRRWQQMEQPNARDRHPPVRSGADRRNFPHQRPAFHHDLCRFARQEPPACRVGAAQGSGKWQRQCRCAHRFVDGTHSPKRQPRLMGADRLC